MSRIKTRKVSRPCDGHRYANNSNVLLAVRFPAEQFDIIVQRADRLRVSAAEIVRNLIDRALKASSS